MKNGPGERISSLMDGELHGMERDGAVDDLLTDEAHRQCWERYHVIGDAMRGNLPGGFDSGLASRVMAALENEPTVLAPTLASTPASAGASAPTPITAPTQAAAPIQSQGPAARGRSLLGRKMTGLAVAASVAAVAVLGVQNLYHEDRAAPAVAPIAKAGVVQPYNRLFAQDVAQATLPGLTRNVQTVNAPRAALSTQLQTPRQLPNPVRRDNPPNLHRYLVDHNRQAARMVVGVMPYARIVTPPYHRMQPQDLRRELMRRELQQGQR